MANPVNINNVLDEAMGGVGGNPKAAGKAKGGTAVAPAAPAPTPTAKPSNPGVEKPQRPQINPPGKDGVKLVAPGTAPIGPRLAGAHACEAIHADKRDLLTAHGRTSLRGALLAHATLSAISAEGIESSDVLKVNELVLTGLRFLSPVPLRPGTVRFLRTTGSEDAKLSSAIRVVSTKVRPDGQFDVTAEFY